ncbi:peptide-methionine (S)-S-oxide reductase MsrA [Streptomyces capparidis]
MLFNRFKTHLPTAEEALPGRPTRPFPVPELHTVLGTPLLGPYPEGLETADFGLGCFWGAERVFWRTPGVWTTLVGYQGGHTPNPTYEEVCSGMTGHTEAVRVVFDPAKVSYETLLKVFWEAHDPTQGHRQGNDVGTQYRSAVYTHSPDQQRIAEASRTAFQQALTAAGHRRDITTEILPAAPFHPAEDYHQQYLDKNPNGYCGLGGTGVKLSDPSAGGSCQTGIASVDG